MNFTEQAFNNFPNHVRIILSQFLFLFGLLLGFSIQAQTYFNDLEDSIHAAYWINYRMVESASAHSGNGYTFADPENPFGLGIERTFPDELKASNVRLSCSGWVKSNAANDQAVFVITLRNEEVTVFWKAIYLSDLLDKTGVWYEFSDEVDVPASITKTGLLKAYLWNSDSKDTIFIDDLKFTLEKLKQPSFIPDLQLAENTQEPEETLFENSVYKIRYDEKNEIVSLIDQDGNPLIHNFRCYTETGSGDFYQTRESGLKLEDVNQKKNRSEIKFRSGNRTFLLNCFVDDPDIEVEVETVFENQTSVHRDALILESAVPVSKVYRANRKIDTSEFQAEYWLERQGVSFADGSLGWYVFNEPWISSLQLATEKKQLWVNLEYNRDHPFLFFPELLDRKDVKIDGSSSEHAAGNSRSNSFTIHVGTGTNLPRLMKNPNGYLAAYIWTEHADFTDISTNRATYFGSEQITEAISATGGFVKYNIPVTKSVFYHNPDQVTNAEVSAGKFTGLESTIKSDPEFEDFLKQIHYLGFEVCLHTPEQFTSNKKSMKKALAYSARTFDSPSWIDHGYNNGSENNRENLVCDGTFEDLENYSMKFWKRKKVSYFWNPYYEDYYTYDTLQFGWMIGKPYIGYGDHIPDPLIWQHPTRTAALWHWPTKSVLYAQKDNKWDFLFSDVVLNDFIDNWEVQFNHCYPAWVDPDKGFWEEKDGVIVASDGFSSTLERMAKLRDDGLLNIPTVQEFIDYQLLIQNVSVKSIGNGQFEITNKNRSEIKGLSMAVSSSEVTVNGQRPQQKIWKDDVIFWFDLEAGETAIVDVTDQD